MGGMNIQYIQSLGRDWEDVESNCAHHLDQLPTHDQLTIMSLARKRRNDRAESPSLPHAHSVLADADEKVSSNTLRNSFHETSADFG